MGMGEKNRYIVAKFQYLQIGNNNTNDQLSTITLQHKNKQWKNINKGK